MLDKVDPKIVFRPFLILVEFVKDAPTIKEIVFHLTLNIDSTLSEFGLKNDFHQFITVVPK